MIDRIPSVAARLVMWFLIIALMPLAIVTILTNTRASDSLRAEATENLQLLVNNKAAQVELYARERKQDATTLARTPDVIRAMRELTAASTDNLPDVQDDQRPFLEAYADLSNYEDLLLISAEGDVLFALEATEHTGDNYRTTPDTLLATIFDRAATLLETEISDFVPQDSGQDATAYIAAPIFDEEVIIGVVVVELNSQILYDVITERRGLGQTGETVVGLQEGEQILVSAPLLYDEDAAFQRTVELGSPQSLALQQAVRGEQNVGVVQDYRGIDTIAAWRYLPSLRWGIVVKQDVSEAFSTITRQQRTAGISAGITVVIVAVLAFLIARSISAPIESLTHAVRNLSQGNLETRAPITGRQDEIGILTRGFNDMAQRLSTLVNSLEERIDERTRRLEEARQEAERSNRAKSRFLANMSHELRTPLNAILGFTQVMERDTSLNDNHQESLRIISRSGQHLLGLINDVLAVSKIEAGQMTLQKSGLDLQNMFQSIRDMFQLTARDKELQFLCEVNESVPHYVITDESKLRQIIINLLSNAFKFTSEGGVALRARYEEGYLHIEVEDTGTGIDKHELEQLFQPFTRTDSSRQVVEGTGLGLAITRQFVEMLGGDINVKSEVGHGTTFKLHIAADITDNINILAADEKQRVVGLPDDETQRRILVVDDKMENRQLLIAWLEATGFEVKEAVNGEEAVALWDTWQPHLIWMDMRMPVMDGYEATRQIKSDLRGQATVIVALTASAFAHERSIVLSAGCDDFVPKPVRESTIFAKMHEHLGIDFIYETNETDTLSLDDEPLTAADLQVLADARLQALRQAADGADLQAVQQLVNTIREEHPALARKIKTLADTFRFDILHDLLSEEQTPHEN